MRRALSSPTPLLPALLAELGEPGARMAARLDLAAGKPLTLDELDELIAAVADELAEPALPLRLSRLPSTRYELGELAARAAPTVGEALARLCRYAPLVHGGISWTRDGARVTQRLDAVRLAPRARQFFLAWLLEQLRTLTGVALRPTRVWLGVPRPRDLGPLARLFDAPLEFGAVDDGFELRAADLAQPCGAADPRLLTTADALAEAALAHRPIPSLTTAERVRRVLAERAGATVEEVATELGMSARTLQRRLSDENTALSSLVDEARHFAARKLLTDHALPLAEIAWRLGFSDLATFSRAFKRWTGLPPGTYRRRL